MNLLLDTCSLLWLTDDPSRLSAPARTALASPGSTVYVSAVSAWELGIKAAKGKLVLPLPVSQWFPAVLAQYGLRELPITADVATASTELPLLHNDPFDRVIVATAHKHQLTLVTHDRILATYPNTSVLW